MGFNISGLAINSSYENKLVELQNDLNLTFDYIEDVNFETASSNWTDEGIAYIYFTPKSTLLFLHVDMCIEPYPIKENNVLSFALSELSMAFSINYTEGKEVKRYIIEHNGEKVSDEGTSFSFENSCDDASEIIWKLLDEVLDTSYDDIDLAATAKKFRVTYGKPVVKQPTQPTDNSETKNIENKDPQQELESKYRQLSNSELIAEFKRYIDTPDVKTSDLSKEEQLALLSIIEERKIGLQHFAHATEKKENNDGCMSGLLLMMLLTTSLIIYAIL
ncbi:hypothetical protein KMW28_21625 [Flammeovirga yaeyamensis]|uniref:Uncharacterized protein n=1 Tax=Flammeovirga yaeyamensis TaxID=367791 RepID=A0AAX1NBY4_9BACT|nr:hypothetical protein [Flammeovirga yaeyamensis]MBB3697046.1 hypothetical protein [Flammeovirga yaeyamensis]NMF33708.1 hypothetical protein [Flammeovirga yaeyamensis]QWG05026.1 hypothetical protein KMW28_21625 [Flammeovirga yaeyamensis]